MGRDCTLQKNFAKEQNVPKDCPGRRPLVPWERIAFASRLRRTMARRAGRDYKSLPRVGRLPVFEFCAKPGDAFRIGADIEAKARAKEGVFLVAFQTATEGFPVETA